MANWLFAWATATFSGAVSSPNPNLCVHCVMRRDVEYAGMCRGDPDVNGYVPHRDQFPGQVRPFDQADIS